MTAEEIRAEAENRYPEGILPKGIQTERKQRQNQRMFKEGAEWAIKKLSAKTAALPVQPTDIKEVTGWDTKEEYVAYEQGREHEQLVTLEWIKQWDGSTNSIMGTLIDKKFKDLAAALPVNVVDVDNEPDLYFPDGDLENETPEFKQVMVESILACTGKYLMAAYYKLGLKIGVDSTLENPENGDKFKLFFKNINELDTPLPVNVGYSREAVIKLIKDIRVNGYFVALGSDKWVKDFIVDDKAYSDEEIFNLFAASLPAPVAPTPATPPH